jgi:hypothetical protein
LSSAGAAAGAAGAAGAAAGAGSAGFVHAAKVPSEPAINKPQSVLRMVTVLPSFT